MTTRIAGTMAFACLIGTAAGIALAASDLSLWLRSTPQASDSPGGGSAAQPYTCPKAKTPPKPPAPNRPFFDTNFPASELQSCLQDGPYKWTSGGDWYTQRIERKVCAGPGATQCQVQRFTRVCSEAGVAPKPAIPSPCEKPTGLRGCAVCTP
jgi:hypothetical protein